MTLLTLSRSKIARCIVIGAAVLTGEAGVPTSMAERVCRAANSDSQYVLSGCGLTWARVRLAPARWRETCCAAIGLAQNGSGLVSRVQAVHGRACLGVHPFGSRGAFLGRRIRRSSLCLKSPSAPGRRATQQYSRRGRARDPCASPSRHRCGARSAITLPPNEPDARPVREAAHDRVDHAIN